MIIIDENVPLAPLTTLKVGGPAKHFARVSTIQDITEALERAEQNHWPIFILGGGSNIIFSDKGFDGLVIKCDMDELDIRSDGTIIAGATVPMGKIVAVAGERGLGGIEWAAGIPGTIGGAVRGNAGAFGGEIKDIIKEVTYIDTDSKKAIALSNADCLFGYRDSVFKKRGGIIVFVKLKLIPNQDPQEIKKIAQEHMQYRAQKHPLEYPSAGSIFKNVSVSEVPEQYLDGFKDSIKNDPEPVVPAAKIIAEAGLSGTKVGDAEVSSKHTNYIINKGDATANDVISLIQKVRETVKSKFDIDLSPEPQIVK